MIKTSKKHFLFLTFLIITLFLLFLVIKVGEICSQNYKEINIDMYKNTSQLEGLFKASIKISDIPENEDLKFTKSNFDGNIIYEKKISSENLPFVFEDNLIFLGDKESPETPKYIYKLTTPKNISPKIIKELELQDENINEIIKQNKTYKIPKDLNEFKEKFKELKISEENSELHIKKGNYYLSETVLFPKGYKLIIDSGVNIYLGEGVSFISYSPFDINGTENEPILITSKTEEPFGTFAYVGDGTKKCKISHLTVKNGNNAMVNWLYMEGALFFYNTDVSINNLKALDNNAEDGVNIKYSNINIKDSIFSGNFSDQFDCDYCNGIIKNNTIKYLGTDDSADGIDISGNFVIIENNNIDGLVDKAISVGEQSNVSIINNTFTNNKTGVAIKDLSKAYLKGNTFTNNVIDINLYQKKEIYGGGELSISKEELDKLKIKKDNKSVTLIKLEK